MGSSYSPPAGGGGSALEVLTGADNPNVAAVSGTRGQLYKQDSQDYFINLDGGTAWQKFTDGAGNVVAKLLTFASPNGHAGDAAPLNTLGIAWDFPGNGPSSLWLKAASFGWQVRTDPALIVPTGSGSPEGVVTGSDDATNPLHWFFADGATLWRFDGTDGENTGWTDFSPNTVLLTDIDPGTSTGMPDTPSSTDDSDFYTNLLHAIDTNTGELFHSIDWEADAVTDRGWVQLVGNIAMSGDPVTQGVVGAFDGQKYRNTDTDDVWECPRGGGSTWRLVMPGDDFGALTANYGGSEPEGVLVAPGHRVHWCRQKQAAWIKEKNYLWQLIDLSDGIDSGLPLLHGVGSPEGVVNGLNDTSRQEHWYFEEGGGELFTFSGVDGENTGWVSSGTIFNQSGGINLNYAGITTEQEGTYSTQLAVDTATFLLYSVADQSPDYGFPHSKYGWRRLRVNGSISSEVRAAHSDALTLDITHNGKTFTDQNASQAFTLPALISILDDDPDYEVAFICANTNGLTILPSGGDTIWNGASSGQTSLATSVQGSTIRLKATTAGYFVIAATGTWVLTP